MTLELRAAVAPKIGFASHQNAVPILADLELVAPEEEGFENLTIELSADPPFLEPRTWRIDRLAQASAARLADRDIRLGAGMLADLNEAVAGTVSIRVSGNDGLLTRCDYPVELLGRSEWGGSASMAELLAAFIMPNDPAVDRVLKAAAEVLRRAGKKDAIDGYEGKSRTRVWEIASAIWSAVSGFRLSYALPPASFELQGQKIRTPSAILDGRLATCLDTALLFSAALEQAGLNPVVVLTKGHAFSAVWLQPQEFSALITDEAASLRKRVDLQELVVFETTLVTQAHPPGFSLAIDEGRRQIAEGRDDGFVMALDVRRARMRRIRPLGSASSVSEHEADAQPDECAGLEEAPILPGFDTDVPSEPETAADRIAIWQRKLLDLTTRNRLLNLPEGARAVRLVCPDPSQLEDLLATGRRIKISAMPDLGEGGRDSELHLQRTGERLLEEYGKAALERGEVLSALDPKRLDATLVDLYRKARSDLDEGGANTLYLALGFLRWHKPDDSRVYRAPLILLPVRLERRSALSGVTMLRHDDEPRFNLTLLEMLRQDFELSIQGLDAALPTDAAGVDVTGIWNTVRRAVRDISGFEVSPEVVVGTFSFAKYLMWKDLADRTEQLKASQVVRHLIERAQERFPGGSDFPQPEKLDDEVAPAELFAPLPADSSQLAAVVGAAKGCDFVLDGPPGTGKSQTIANIIAHNLALGRRVLFVAEKMAALDVVHRRLADIGLGEFCLELHSSKTSKTEVLKRLERAWDAQDALSPEEWANEAEQVKRLRDRLNEVVRLLHKKHPNGLTLHQAIGRVVRDWTPDMVDLGWSQADSGYEPALDVMRELSRRLDLNWALVNDLPDKLAPVAQREWSNGWQERVLALATEIGPRGRALKAGCEALLQATGLPLRAEAPAEVTRLTLLTAAILSTRGADLRFAFAPDAVERIARARRLSDAVEEFRAGEARLSVPYTRNALLQLDIDKFDAEWSSACRRIAPIAFLARRGVAKRLQHQGKAAARPDPGQDLSILRHLLELRAAIASLSGDLADFPFQAELDGNPAEMRRIAGMAEALRAAVSAAAENPEQLVEIRRAVATHVLDANELLTVDGPVARAAAKLERCVNQWEEVTAGLCGLLAVDPDPTRRFDDVSRLALSLVSAAPRLKAWCDWQRVRREAVDAGLMTIVQALEAGAVPKGGTPDLFETVYSRWFAARGIDAEPRLRDLVTAEHADEIEAFRRLDDKLAALSVRYIRAKICGSIPDKAEVSRRDGYGILMHELRKQRAHKPVRQLAIEMGNAFTRLAPCMLMSPLSIAQYLPPDQTLFDLVIFDEASQIAPWDAVGSIARGKQVVIAGDPRQMPPTNFFNRGGPAADDDVEDDMESILDECLAAGIPSHGLTWHYRSRHESLIAFSNHRFYDGNLITFPAAVTQDSAVEWRRVEGLYAKGRGRTNQAEAEAIVAEIVRRLTDPAIDQTGHTIGVVTLNAEQQTLIENLLDVERQRRPEMERFFGEHVLEPVVVKNLETVQGDERDIILIGIGYGPTEPGANTMSMNFGPLNRDGGWRRLNVAVTRARRGMVVFTSFNPGMIDLNRTNARAVRDLKHFIEFAERGPRALGEAVQGSQGSYESPFEQAVASGLCAKGWSIVPQIGASRFRIDLGVVHPDRPGDYLVGVECDGAAYHSAATARDRDKIRASILTGLGWNLVRVWSTDWWVDKQSALQRLDDELRTLLEQSRASQPPALEAPRPDLDLSNAVPPGRAVDAVRPTEPATAYARLADGTAASPPRVYREADLSAFSAAIDPIAFHEPTYDEHLRAMVEHVLGSEAPISADALVHRVARAHGFQRSGRLIRDRVLGLTARFHHLTEEPSGSIFVWHTRNDPAQWRSFRVPAAGSHPRSIEDIPLEEIRAAAAAVRGSDPISEVAHTFGLKRLTAATRRRLEEAMHDSGRLAS